MVEIIKTVLLNPGFVAGMRTTSAQIEEVPPSEWPAEHERWDYYERAARELFNFPEPWPVQIGTVVYVSELCVQALRSRHDPAMLDRVTRMLNLPSHDATLKFARLFTAWIVAERPAVAA
jgi:hypothetical protein